jgi:hypothetical protein
MNKANGHTETRITSFGSGRRWRFVRTNYGIEYCVDQLLFQDGRLWKVKCYRFSEDGSKLTVQLRPADIQDFTEISEFLNREQG